MTELDVRQKYGAIVDGTWPDQAKHCVLMEVPAEVSRKVINTANGIEWTHVYVNRDMAGPLLQALQYLISRGCLDELETFDGCFMIRPIRGSTNAWSAHSWALAIDLNAKANPLGGPTVWSDEFVKCFTDAGFTWGGKFLRVDGQHFSWAGF